MTKNSKTSVSQHDEHDKEQSASSQHIRKRNKFLNMFRSDKSEAHANPLAVRPNAKVHHTDTVSIVIGDDHGSAHLSTAASSSEAATPPTTEKTKVRVDIFFTNEAKPAAKTVVPKLGAGIDNTPQLALCSSLLPRNPASAPSKALGLEVDLQIEEAPQDTSVNDANLEWAKAIQQNAMEQSHVRWLLERMVNEFVKDAVKGSAAVIEIVLLGPVLDHKHYRKLLSCFINEFEKAIILDIDLLHGLVQLVQGASEGYLIADDLIKILSVLRTRLQQVDQQSSMHPYHLTLAVSRLLDVMARHEVKDLDRVEQHEPLGAVLSSLQGTADPFLMYQALNAFQALQYVPDDETVLQAVMRHSGLAAEGPVGISGVLNLNLSGFLEGLGQLQKITVERLGIAKAAIEGARSLIERGNGVFEALKQGVSSGNKRAWYPAIIGANALVREGRLADFKTVVMEAACRQSPEFQWGICQLLAEVALDTTWEIATRRQAVDFLAELYTNDPEWGRDASVKTWIITIFRIVSENSERSIHGPAAVLQVEIDKATAVQFAEPHLLRSRLPVPEVSPLLARVQEIPPFERDLDQLRSQRLRGYDQKVYVPPQAKASLQASDKEAKPLIDMVKEFLGSDRQVFLVLGDSATGKSTFARHLEHELWEKYTVGGPIPLFINLPAIEKPHENMIEKLLQVHNFSDDKIKEIIGTQQIVLICDGYDETQLKINLHAANKLNQEGQAKTKMIISCRSTYFGSDYRSLFQPQPIHRYSAITTDAYTEAVIVPFSSDQVEDYVRQFVRDPEVHKLMGGRAIWSTENYIDRLKSIPNMMELVRNPFLLSLSLRALPGVVKDAVDLANVKVTRLTLFDSFIKQWLEISKLRLENINHPAETKSALEELLEDGFTMNAIDYSKDLAAAIFKEQDGNPVVQYTPRVDKKTWKVEFFGPEPHITLLRESSPLSRSGVQYKFFHRSLLEYFYSRHVYEFTERKNESEVSWNLADHPLSLTNLAREPSIVQFLAEHVQRDSAFKHGLDQFIEQSKSDVNASQAASNAITILVRAGVKFNGADLQRIRISGADLSGGQFDSAQLQGADLRNTNLRNIWLRQANLSEAQVAGVRFGELPFLEEKCGVGSCAYSMDGETFAVALEDGSISLYKTSTWEKANTLNGHTNNVTSVMFSPKGQQIASGSSDRTVRLWDAQTGAPGEILKGHTLSINSVVFSPNGQQIASGSDDETVRLWDAQTGAPGAILKGHSSGVTSVVFSPSGQQIASGSNDRTIRLWDAETGVPGNVVECRTFWVKSLVFSPCRQQIASGNSDGTARLWDAQTGAPGAILKGDNFWVRSVAFAPNGQQIATGNSDKTVRLWDVQTGTPGAILKGHTSDVLSVVFSPSGQLIASGSDDNTVRLWDAQIGAPGAVLSGHEEKVASVALSPNGQQVASGSHDQTVRLWDAQTGAPGTILNGHTDWVRSAVFSPNGQEIASGSEDRTVRIWDAQTGALGVTLSGHSSGVTSVMFSPSGRQIASGSKDQTVRLWDAQTGAPGVILCGHTDWVMSVVFSPDGQQIASGSGDWTVRLWDAQTGVPGSIFTGHTDYIRSVVFSPSGQQVASGSWDKTVRLWNAHTGIPGVILRGHTSYVTSVAFSPSGKQIASGSEDMTMRLWNVDSGQCLTVVKEFYGSVKTVAWYAHGDGSYIATGCQDKSIRLWQVIGDRHLIHLRWSSTHDRLVVSNTNISNTQGLSEKNRKLLEMVL